MEIHEIYYNYTRLDKGYDNSNYLLQSSGEPKTFTVPSLDHTGLFAIKVGGPSAGATGSNAGLTMYCRTSDTGSPWYNFRTDLTRWRVQA